MKTKKAAMEMSMGTIVTIVLLMSVLILGLVMIRTIFRTSTDNINAIDQKVKDQINTIFSEDDQARMVIYPSRTLKIKKGNSESGFGISIRNVFSERTVFSYEITNTGSTCNLPKSNAESLIPLGRTGTNIQLAGGDVMGEPRLILFDISEGAVPCKVQYDVVTTYVDNRNVKTEYDRQNIILEITGK